MSALPSPERPPSTRLAALPTLADVYRAHAADVGRWAGRLGGPGVDVDDAEHPEVAGPVLDTEIGRGKPFTNLLEVFRARTADNHFPGTKR